MSGRAECGLHKCYVGALKLNGGREANARSLIILEIKAFPSKDSIFRGLGKVLKARVFFGLSLRGIILSSEKTPVRVDIAKLTFSKP